MDEPMGCQRQRSDGHLPLATSFQQECGVICDRLLVAYPEFMSVLEQVNASLEARAEADEGDGQLDIMELDVDKAIDSEGVEAPRCAGPSAECWQQPRRK